MNNRLLTIEIKLPNGDPYGIRTAEITDRTVRIIEIPRSHLNDFFNMPEAKHVGIYFLIHDDGVNKPSMYIGQTSNLINRLREHDNKKCFWDRALVMISLLHRLTITHAYYLEWLSIKRANEANRYTLKNSNAGSCPHTPDSLESACLNLFDTTELLLSTLLGKPVFTSKKEEAIAENNQISAEQGEIFYLRSPQYGVEAKGLYSSTNKELRVLQGSTLRQDCVPSFKGTKTEQQRQELLESGTLTVDQNGVYQFTQDYIFKSPSGASDVILGRSSNGWIEWRNEAGKTLDELKRKN
jgi:hypothetical protein